MADGPRRLVRKDGSVTESWGPSEHGAGHGVSRHSPGCPCSRCTGLQPGNRLSAAHGARGEQSVAPLRVALDAELAREFPELHPARRAVLADRMARLAKVREFVDEKGGLIRDPNTGEPWPILHRIDGWERAVDQTIRELEQERSVRREGEGLSELAGEGRALRLGQGDDR